MKEENEFLTRSLKYLIRDYIFFRNKIIKSLFCIYFLIFLSWILMLMKTLCMICSHSFYCNQVNPI